MNALVQDPFITNSLKVFIPPLLEWNI